MNDPLPTRRTVHFGPFDLDFVNGQLRKRGLKIKLQEKPLQILEILLEHPGKLVTRDELRQRLWPTDVFVDFDNALNTAVNKIREALNDSADNPRYIETVPRKGYCFLAPLEKGSQNLREGTRAMLAVLPFQNLTPDAGQDYFADGMTEEMIAQLGRLQPGKLGVIARTSAMQYKGTTKKIDQIGEELGVDYILEGSVRRGGQLVRITAQLIQVKDQSHLWAETYNRNLDDILAIQTDVANHIARSLAVELLPEQQAVMSLASTKNYAAYEAYLKGRYYWNKRTQEGFNRAVIYFQQAIDKEPSYALPWVGLADLYDVLGLYGWMRPKESYEKATFSAKKALELHENLAEAHTSMAYAMFLYDWNWACAEKEFKLSLDLNPNHVTGHYWYALFLAAMGRFEDSYVQMQNAFELDPLSLVTNCHKGWIFYFARQYDQAIEEFLKVLEMDPDFALPHYFLGLTYNQKGMHDKAIEEIRIALEATQHEGATAALSACYALAGKKAAGRKLMEKMEETSNGKHLSPYMVALGYVGLGDKEAAFRCLEEAYEERSPWLTNINVEPALDGLRSDARFNDLLRRVGFKSH